MAEKKSGPVKPPTLDMQARRASPRTPSKASEPAKTEAPETEPVRNASKAEAPKAMPTSGTSTRTSSSASQGTTASRSARTAPAPNWVIPAALGAGGGALIGVLVTLGLAASGILGGLMPSGEDSSGLADRLTIAEEQVTEGLVGYNALNQQVSALQEQVAALQTGQSDNLDVLTSRQDQLAEALTAIESTPPEVTDLSPLQTEIDQLSARIDALAAGASGDEATQLAEDLTAIQAQLAALDARTAELTSQFDGIGTQFETLQLANAETGQTLETLQSDLAALQAEPAIPEADSQLLRLPLALSGLEAALQNGRPFAPELESLAALVPSVEVPQNLSAAAETGLPAPTAIITAFARAVPDMMAARPADPDASWSDTLWDRARALLAIRPSEPGTGDPIDSALAEAETALENRNFAAAAEALSGLPDPMQLAARDEIADIALMGEVETFLQSARAMALNPEEGGAE